MRFFTGLFLALSFIPPTCAQKNSAGVPIPNHFEIGRQTFFDFGPPFDYYELLLVQSSGSGSAAQRIVFTPPGDACLVPAKMEVASASINESVSAILGNANPCAIAERELRRELKRCKHCVLFSGVNVTMRVNCGGKVRLIRSDILDRDIFDSTPKTPEHTSWTMQLLSRLDQALGPGVMEKPAFPLLGEDQSKQTNLDSEVLERLKSGAYDTLFPKADIKLFDLYRAAQVSLPVPSVRLLDSSPFAPKDPVLPTYPPLAKAARVQGIVGFMTILDAAGAPTFLSFTQGHKLLLDAVRQAAGTWKFPEEAAGQMVSVSIKFSLNCFPPLKETASKTAN